MKRKSRVILTAVLAAILFAGGFSAGVFYSRENRGAERREPETVSLLRLLAGEDTCYVVGHKSPDTDSVCSAMLLCELLRGYGIDCVPAVAGKLNNETAFVLSEFGLETPELLEDASGKKIILVDHSETPQMADSMENAEIIGIFDHHAVGSVTTFVTPVYECRNVGATVTVLLEEYRHGGRELTKKEACLAACAILSDTADLTKSTAVGQDREALALTARIAGIDDPACLYEKMRQASESYDGMTDEEIFLSDYKEYELSGVTVGIACVNASGTDSALALTERLRAVMAEIYPRGGMKHLYLSVKNAEDNENALVGYGGGTEEILTRAFGSAEPVFRPSVSRKKDIVPALERVYAAAP